MYSDSLVSSLIRLNCPCSGVDWPALWQPPAATTEFGFLKRTCRPAQTSRCSRWSLRWPKRTARMWTVFPGTRRKLDFWPPAATVVKLPFAVSKTTDTLTRIFKCYTGNIVALKATRLCFISGLIAGLSFLMQNCISGQRLWLNKLLHCFWFYTLKI